MEEDIKIVEDLKNKWELNAFGDMVNVLSLNEIKALENLIKGYRELEEVLNKYGGVKELEKYIMDLSRFLGNVPIDVMLNKIKNDFIPKSKIRKNIEELKEQRRLLGFKAYLRIEDMLNDDRAIACQISVLENILEEEV